jgi:hypothetical protein
MTSRYVGIAALALAISGCYSFRGGSAPANIKTVAIPPAEDVSGYGRGTVRQELTTLLINRFRDDNTLRIADPASADSRLEVTITGIRSEQLNLSGNELETVRGIVIDTRVTFNDNGKRRPVYKDRTFTGRSQYNINRGTAGENEAISEALEKVSEAILLATVADW